MDATSDIRFAKEWNQQEMASDCSALLLIRGHLMGGVKLSQERNKKECSTGR